METFREVNGFQVSKDSSLFPFLSPGPSPLSPIVYIADAISDWIRQVKNKRKHINQP